MQIKQESLLAVKSLDELKTPQSTFTTSVENLLEETSDTMNILDECTQSLMTAMKKQNAADTDSVKCIIGCAKEIREMMKLKLHAAKFIHQTISKP